MFIWNRTPDPLTHSSTLLNPQCSRMPDNPLMPDMAAGSKARGQPVGLPPRPGKDDKLYPAEWASD